MCAYGFLRLLITYIFNLDGFMIEGSPAVKGAPDD